MRSPFSSKWWCLCVPILYQCHIFVSAIFKYKDTPNSTKTCFAATCAYKDIRLFWAPELLLPFVCTCVSWQHSLTQHARNSDTTLVSVSGVAYDTVLPKLCSTCKDDDYDNMRKPYDKKKHTTTVSIKYVELPCRSTCAGTHC